MKAIKRIIFITIILGIIAYGGVWAYSAFKSTGVTEGGPELPKAEYQIKIVATGLTVFADMVEAEDVGDGLHIYTLPNGYWEVRGSKYVFKDVPLSLDERVFGEIKVTKL